MRARPPLLAALALLGLVACGDDEDRSAGTLTLYSGRAEAQIAPVLAQFTEATGIDVELRAGQSGELAAQLLTEGDASPADLFFSQDAGALGAVEAAGLTATLPADVLDAVDPTFRSATGGWIGTSGRVRVIVYNSELVPDPPDEIDELIDERWRGRLGFAPTNASWQSFVTGLRVLRGEDGARRWLESFAALDPVAYEDNPAVRDAVDRGEVVVGLVNHYYVYEKIAAEGDDLSVRNQFMAPGDPGGLFNVAGIAVLESSNNEDLAVQLVRYLTGTEGQTYFATSTFEFPLVAGIAARPELPSIDELEPPAIDLADLSSLAATQELLADVGLLTS